MQFSHSDSLCFAAPTRSGTNELQRFGQSCFKICTSTLLILLMNARSRRNELASVESLMIKLIRSKDDDEWMPPKGPRLEAQEIEILERWINEGLPWEDGITLGESSWEPPLKPRKVKLPLAHQGRDHPIDRILDAGMAKQKVTIRGLAPDAVFLRRATLDIVGLLPTPVELESFLRDSDPDKRAKAIDRLLARDIAYADHWLTMWNERMRRMSKWAAAPRTPVTIVKIATAVTIGPV